MGDFAANSWRFVPNTSAPGPLQMALEEVAAETAATEGLCLIRVFSWEPSTLSLGYGQDPDSVNWQYCQTNGIEVTRRQTGGGGIYHDRIGDISYSIVLPAADVADDLLTSYHRLCEPILKFFERIDIDASFATQEYEPLYEPACFLRGIHPAHDIVVDGRKICGNAQYRQRDAIIQHGSINVRLTPEAHLGVFAQSDIDREAFCDRVTAISQHGNYTRSTVVKELEASLTSWAQAQLGSFTDAERASAREIARQKYRDSSWIRKRPQTHRS